MQGISFLEIAGILVVLSILAQQMAPDVLRNLKAENYRETEAHLQTLKEALQLYYRDNGTFPIPTTDVPGEGKQGLSALLYRPTSEPVPAHWNQKYFKGLLSELTTDAWGTEIKYQMFTECESTCTEFDPSPPLDLLKLYDLTENFTVILTSLGSDRAEGGGDDIQVALESGAVVKDIKEETLQRLRVVMRVVGHNIMNDLNPPSYTDALDAEAQDQAVLQLSGEVGSHFLVDFWGHRFLWNSSTQSFFSQGPDGINQTQANPMVADQDIAY